MAQFNRGRYELRAGGNTVRACFEALCLDAVSPFKVDGGIIFDGTEEGRVMLHSVSSGLLVFRPADDLAVIAATASVHGALDTSVTSGTATAGGSNYLEDSGASWSDDQHNARMVQLRPGEVDEEWRTIADTTASPRRIVVVPNWDSNPAASDDYVIWEAQTASLSSFMPGTPPDWSITGSDIKGGHLFIPQAGAVLTVQADASERFFDFTGAAWSGSDHLGESIVVHKDFSANLSLPLPASGDARPTALIRDLVSLLDNIITGRKLTAYLITYFGAGWSGGSAYIEKDYGRRVRCGGVATQAGGISPPSTVFTVPASFRPANDIHWVLATDVNNSFAHCKLVASTGVLSVEYLFGVGGDTILYLDQLSWNAASL